MQVDRGDPQGPPQVVTLDPAVGHPRAPAGPHPGRGASHHRTPPPIALLEGPGHRLTAGSAQLVLVPMEADRPPPLGSGAAPTQRAVLAPAGEAGLTGAGDRRDLARRAPEDASLPVDPEVVGGEPARHRALERDGLDRLAVAGGPKGRTGRPGAIAAVAQHLQPRVFGSEQLDPGPPVRGGGGSRRTLGHQPGLWFGGEVALVAVTAGRAGLAGMPGLRVDD